MFVHIFSMHLPVTCVTFHITKQYGFISIFFF